MKIHKALKVKNRLIGEITRLRQIIQRENSRRIDSTSKVDVLEVMKELNKTENEFVEIKSRISVASAPIAQKLSHLEYLKDKMKFMYGLNTRDGVEIASYDRNGEPIEHTWKATITQEIKDDSIVGLQNQINTLQDEIDEFNASTSV